MEMPCIILITELTKYFTRFTELFTQVLLITKGFIFAYNIKNKYIGYNKDDKFNYIILRLF